MRRSGGESCAANHSHSSRTRRVFPTPASPRMVTSCGPPPAATAPYASWSWASSTSLPTNARRSPPTPRGRISDSARTSRRHSSPPAFPFASTVIGSPNSNAPRAASTVRAPARISPGAAACSSRAPTFTASPLTNELPSRGRPRPLLPCSPRSAAPHGRRTARRADAASRAPHAARAPHGPPAPPAPRTPP